jgi:putative ATPase
VDLFSRAFEEEQSANAPLAYRMRPRTLDEVVGQRHLIGPGAPLSKAIKEDKLHSMILFGPPGSGKTTIALIISKSTKAHFEPLSAITTGVAELKGIINEAKDRLKQNSKRTVVFIDEIHRFTRSQQDVLLKAVEEGIIYLIGATTENPFFRVNRPLLSRCRMYKLEPIDTSEIKKLLWEAVTDPARGYGSKKLMVEEKALDMIAQMASGDARAALGYLEQAVELLNEGGSIDEAYLHSLAQKGALPFAKDDEHYDVTSCFIKSMRGSDAQATLYWLARLLQMGEDVEYIARRIMIHAAEDVGLADPRALILATSASLAAERVGMPEARIILAEAALYVALAKKSNSVVVGIDQAMKAVEDQPGQAPPPAMRDSSYKGAKLLGHGVGYMYPHDFPGHWVKQQYLPDMFKDAVFYSASDQGEEPDINRDSPSASTDK